MEAGDSIDTIDAQLGFPILTNRWTGGGPGKSMLVCIDKITCARMLKLIRPKWQVKAAAARTEAQLVRSTHRACLARPFPPPKGAGPVPTWQAAGSVVH